MSDVEKYPQQIQRPRAGSSDGSSATDQIDDANFSSNTLTEKQTQEAAQHTVNDNEKQLVDVSHPAPVDAEKPTANDYNSIPDGGLQAWLQVAAAFCLFFNTWGVLNTFGVFQTYYESGQLFTQSSSNISWIGSIQSYCVLLGGLIAGPIFDRGYLRTLLVTGGFAVVFGFMMLSLCHEYWQVLLAQGFCLGLGASCLFVPSVAILPTYFKKRLGLAMGLAAAGSSFGGIIYPIVFYRLINQIGYGWSVRVLGFIALATMLMPIFCMKMRVKPPRVRAMIDWTAFTDWPYIFFVVGTMIGFMGLYVMLFYISYYGAATGIADASLSFYIVPILNAGSMFGRTLPNAMADITGPFNMIAPGAICCSIIIFCMMAVNSSAALIVMALLFGFFSGVFIALPPVCMVVLTKDKTKIGTRIGMAFAILGFGVLTGGPGGGAILNSNGTSSNWKGLWAFAGVTECVAGLAFIALRVWKTGPKIKAKF